MAFHNHRWILASIAVIALVGAVQAAAPDKAPEADKDTAVLLHFDQTPPQGPNAGDVVGEGAPPLVDGKFGKALDCSKLGGGQLTAPAALRGEHKNLTIECWIRPDGPVQGKMQRIVGQSGTIGLYAHRKGEQITFFCKTGKARESWKAARFKISPGQWNHVAGTYDGQTMRLYINGELVRDVENPGTVTIGGAPFFLGREASKPAEEPSNVFNGALDEIRISTVTREF